MLVRYQPVWILSVIYNEKYIYFSYLLERDCEFRSSYLTKSAFLPLGKTLQISHCTYCTCRSGSNGTQSLSCYTSSGVHSTSITSLRPSDKLPSRICSFCPSPDVGVTLKPRSVYRPKNFECIECTCSRVGSLSCEYGVKGLTIFRKCLTLNQCKTLIEEFENGTRSYKCNKCVDVVQQIPVTRAPSEGWKVNVWGRGLSCVCTNEGEIVCFTKEKKVYSVTSKGYCRNCTTMKAREFMLWPKGKCLLSDIEGRMTLGVYYEINLNWTELTYRTYFNSPHNK